MTKSGYVILTVVALCFMVLDFFSRVYVPFTESVTPWQSPETVNTVVGELDSVSKLKKLLKQQAKDNTIPLPSPVLSDKFDTKQFGEVQLSLIAIYDKSEPAAVLAIKGADKKLTYKHVITGDNIADIKVQQVSKRDVLFVYVGQEKSLKLFTPLDSVKER